MSKGIYFKDIPLKDRLEKVEYIRKFCIWFKDLFGIDVYLMYGTLLGAIRENNFIDSDNDIDLAYISKYHKFEDVFKEMIMINLTLSNLGHILSFGEGSGLPRHSGHAHIFSEDKKCVFDVWTSWIGEDNKYYFYSMGMGLDSSVLLPLTTGTILDKKLPIPCKSEKLLEYLYTADWKKPLNRKSYYYNKNYWEPLIDIYITKVLNHELKK